MNKWIISRVFKEWLGKPLLKTLCFWEKFWLLFADASKLTIYCYDLGQEKGLEISLFLSLSLVLTSNLVVHLVDQIMYILLASSILVFVSLHFVLAILKFSLLVVDSSSYLLNFIDHMWYWIQIVVIWMFGLSFCPKEQCLKIIDALGEVR